MSVTVVIDNPPAPKPAPPAAECAIYTLISGNNLASARQLPCFPEHHTCSSSQPVPTPAVSRVSSHQPRSPVACRSRAALLQTDGMVYLSSAPLRSSPVQVPVQQTLLSRHNWRGRVLPFRVPCLATSPHSSPRRSQPSHPQQRIDHLPPVSGEMVNCGSGNNQMLIQHRPRCKPK